MLAQHQNTWPRTQYYTTTCEGWPVSKLYLRCESIPVLIIRASQNHKLRNHKFNLSFLLWFLKLWFCYSLKKSRVKGPIMRPIPNMRYQCPEFGGCCSLVKKLRNRLLVLEEGCGKVTRLLLVFKFLLVFWWFLKQLIKRSIYTSR